MLYSSFVKNLVEKSLVKAGERVCVALSGGADSMVLLDCFLRAESEFKIKVCAVNIEHGIRGDESKKDSLFVKEYCEKRGVQLYCFSADIPALAKEKGLSLETAARVFRYSVFEKIRLDAEKIALAHHSDDNAETVLLHLFRGSGAGGLKGMEYIRNDYYIRPLLDVSKNDIYEYAKKNALPYVIDFSNDDSIYDRNYIRNEIIPALQKRFSGVCKNIETAARLLGQDDDYINSVAAAEGFETVSPCVVKIRTESLKKHPAIGSRVIFLALKSIGINADIERKHIDIIIGLSNGGRNGAFVHLPCGLSAHKEYGHITISKGAGDVTNAETQAEIAVSRKNFFENSKFVLKNHVIKIDISDKNRYSKSTAQPMKKVLYMDSDKLQGDTIIRFMRTGDVFKKLGGGGKKLCDYFTDIKIPLRERGNIPLLCLGNEVLCVIGCEISDNVKITDKTKNISRIYLETVEISKE